MAEAGADIALLARRGNTQVYLSGLQRGAILEYFSRGLVHWMVDSFIHLVILLLVMLSLHFVGPNVTTHAFVTPRTTRYIDVYNNLVGWHCVSLTHWTLGRTFCGHTVI